MIIFRDEQPAAVLVPLDMLEAFDRAEDELLARQALARLDAAEPTVSMVEVIADLFGEADSR